MISVLTATLPEREGMLAEAVASVKQQGHEVQHLIGVDHTRRGAGPVLNDLLADAVGEWVMVVDDDDLLLPHHLDTIQPVIESDGWDVIYTLPEVEGGGFFNYERPYDPQMLRRFNMVSHNAAMRTELVRQVGGWAPVKEFDWRMFQALSGIGARFCRLPERTWVYRVDHEFGNWSRGTLV